MHFGDWLTERARAHSPLVAGVDPDFRLMPEELRPRAASREAVAESLVSFCRTVVDAVTDRVAAVKIQSAYFEQFGTAGIQALAAALAHARERGLPVILDVKRGDIGSTSSAYARAYLGSAGEGGGDGWPASDLEADCITVNPFLGEDAMQPFVAQALAVGKGLFVLVKTSNPGSATVMGDAADPASVSARLAALVERWGSQAVGASGYSSIGAVVGATAPREAATLRRLMPHTLFLAPGVGAQGGTVETALAAFKEDGTGAVVPISRSLTYPGEDEVARLGYAGAVRERARRFAGELAAASRRQGGRP